jgi:hypothetical protein
MNWALFYMDYEQKMASIKLVINLILLHPEALVISDHVLASMKELIVEHPTYDDKLYFYQLRWLFLVCQQNESRLRLVPRQTDHIDWLEHLWTSVEIFWQDNSQSFEHSEKLVILVEQLKIMYTFVIDYAQRWSITSFPYTLITK